MNTGTHRHKPAARVIVFDDAPGPLLTGIGKYYKHLTRAELEFILHASLRKSAELGRLMRDARPDFVMLDDRLDGKFVGYKSGAEVGLAIRREWPRIPMALISAFDEMKRSDGAYRSDVEELLRTGGVTIYKKRNLIPSADLKPMCSAIQDAVHQAKERNVLEPLLNRKIVSERTSRFRVQKFDGRRSSQFLEALDTPGGDIYMPTRFLKRAGLKHGRATIAIVITEFEGGEVLSRIRIGDEVPGKLAADLKRVLLAAE